MDVRKRCKRSDGRRCPDFSWCKSTSIMLGLCSSIVYHLTFSTFKMYFTVSKIVSGVIMPRIFHVEGNFKSEKNHRHGKVRFSSSVIKKSERWLSFEKVQCPFQPGLLRPARIPTLNLWIFEMRSTLREKDLLQNMIIRVHFYSLIKVVFSHLLLSCPKSLRNLNVTPIG